jgi:hypothetical protein
VDPSQASDSGRIDARRSARPLVKIPIRVEGKDGEGKPFSETTYTLTINWYGGRITLKNPLRLRDEITITNLKTNQACPFRVVVRLDVSLGWGVEWGVECLCPETDFWQVYFPEKKEKAPLPEKIEALLECATCHTREMTPLARGDFREIIRDSPLTRACAKCGRETEWRLGLLDFTPEEMASPAISPLASQLAAPGGAERRRDTRYVVLLPLCIRDESGREEVTRSENVSKSGVCFGSNLEMGEGSAIHLTMGPAGGEQAQMPARIAWRRPFGAGRFLYGVRLLEAG